MARSVDHVHSMIDGCIFYSVISVTKTWKKSWRKHLPVFLPTTWNLSETALLSIVIPRSCSSSLLSIYRILPAIRDEIILFAASIESMSVVFPWSTCPSVVIIRMVALSEVFMRVKGKNVQSLVIPSDAVQLDSYHEF